MAKTMFAASVVLKIVAWAAMALGLYLAVRALLDGEIFLALLLIFIIIPVGLGILAFALGIVQMLVITPIALLTGRTREMREFSKFQIEVAERAGAQRLTLRQGKILLGMFEEIPPGDPKQPPRSGAELVALYDELHPVDEEEDDDEDEDHELAGELRKGTTSDPGM